MAPAPKIKLYVDTVSPFAYIAYHVLRHNPVFQGCEVTYEPIFLGGVMAMSSNQPPIKIKNKNVWIGKERLRWAKIFDVPMNQDMPPNFPPLTLPVVRALTVIQQELGSEKLMAALDVLFEEFFVNHAPTHEPAELARVLAGCLGGEAEAKRVMEATTTDAIKQAVQAKTKAAFDDGAFGLPWIVCTKTDGTTEGFWGVDHLAMVADFLGLEKPAEGWKALL